MRVFESVQALRSAVGEHIGYSDWHTVTQEQINAFADATGDHQWIHVDPAAAAKGPFGTTIAHGFLTLSLIPMLASQVSRGRGRPHGRELRPQQGAFPGPAPVRQRGPGRRADAQPSRTSPAACTSSTR